MATSNHVDIDIIRLVNLRPMVTEKGVNRQTYNHVLFRVSAKANKYQIMLAVKALYSVEALNVRTIRMKPKVRRRANTVGKTVAWKKAYVTVPDIKALNLIP